MSRQLSVDAEGVALAAEVYDGPSGAPSLLLIPGLGSTRRVYHAFIPWLTPAFTVVSFDTRGTGDSGMTDPPWSMDMLADDAALVLRAASAGPAVVFGASMGGMVAQVLALNHPAAVSRLVLAATSAGGASAAPRDLVARAKLLGKGATSPEGAYRLACTVLYSEEFQRSNSAFIEAQIRDRAIHPVRARVFTAQGAASAAHDTTGRLDELTMPVLVMHGTADAVIPVADGRTLAAAIPGAELDIIEGGSHLFFQEDPEAVAARIRAFSGTP